MKLDKRIIETMLTHYAQFLRELDSREGGGLLGESIEAVEEQRDALSQERKAEELAVFAGTFPPSDPIELFRMWSTILEDVDTLSDYVGVDDWEGTALWEAWQAADDAILALRPDTPEAATAIAFGARHDLETGIGDGEWRPYRVRKARKLALAELPKPI